MKAHKAILGALALALALILAVITAGYATSDSSGSASGNAARNGSRFPLVRFSISGRQAIGSDLVTTQDFSITPTIRSGHACFAMGSELMEWPAGYSAATFADGKFQVLDAQGKVVLRTGQPAEWEQAEISAGANACVSKPSMVVVVLEVVPQPG